MRKGSDFTGNNEVCLKCSHICKQSAQVAIINCPKCDVPYEPETYKRKAYSTKERADKLGRELVEKSHKRLRAGNKTEEKITVPEKLSVKPIGQAQEKPRKTVKRKTVGAKKKPALKSNPTKSKIVKKNKK